MGDLDNDGVDDLISAQFNGGTTNVFFSRWSNGTPAWQKVQLPDGLYGSNTNFNDVTIADINGDDLKDILFAETRREPYYTGRAIQVLVNKGNGVFTDETGLRINNAPRDVVGGEGELNALDIDGDGDLDLIDSSVPIENGRRAPSGTSVALNDGTGHFTWVSNEIFAYVQPFQIKGYEYLESTWTEGPGRMIPIDLDGKNGLDFVGLAQTPLLQWPVTDPINFIMFTAISTLPLGQGIDGSSGADVLNGTAANDVLNGFSGNDKLRGFGGNDRLDGGRGIDRLEGGKGNDTYVVDAARDLVIELSNHGRDTVLTSVSYTLGSSTHIEVLSALLPDSTTSLNLTGNKYSNSITGNSGNNILKGGEGSDRLYGGLGNDRLSGGSGRDVFVFDTKPHKTKNMDTVSDFSVADDTIWLNNAVFTKVGSNGRLKDSALWIGSRAHDRSDRIIYDDHFGALYYDADGSGKAGQIKLAQIEKGLSLTHIDFYVI
jgi:Ca2+-binding RTX toxin-like protein